MIAICNRRRSWKLKISTVNVITTEWLVRVIIGAVDRIWSTLKRAYDNDVDAVRIK